MLTQLTIKNIVLIDSLQLNFDGGLTVLTGETGAGKSILLDALGLALGARADFGLIRKDEDSASVTACFAVSANAPFWQHLEHASILPCDELILRRNLKSDGRSQAYLNDEPVSLSLLRQIGDELIEIQGQFEGRGLLDVSGYLPLIDRACQHPDRLLALSEAWQSWQDASDAFDALQLKIQQSREEEDWLRDAIEQLDVLTPQPDEESALVSERALHAHTAKLSEALMQATVMLADDEGAEALAGRAERILESHLDVAGERLSPALEAIQRARMELQEADSQMRAIADTLDGDPARLGQIDDRLFELRAQARKHKTDADRLADTHISLAEQLSQIDDSASLLSEYARDLEDKFDAYKQLASVISERRHSAAHALDRAVMAELPPLKLEAASFRTDITLLEEARWSVSGFDRIRFAARTNPGMAEDKIDKIASGGELARFLLALKVALSENEPAKTLIFDEVDSGVGGAVAAAVGARLARLGRAMQTLVITHSPQVAAAADHHFHIAKTNLDEMTISRTVQLDRQERIEEIARMLSGDQITEQARAAAVALIGGQ